MIERTLYILYDIMGYQGSRCLAGDDEEAVEEPDDGEEGRIGGEVPEM